MSVTLMIVLEPPTGKPVSMARVNNRRLLIEAAAEAVHEAERKAEEWAGDDEVLGRLQKDEAGRLRRALALVIPEVQLELAEGANSLRGGNGRLV